MDVDSTKTEWKIQHGATNTWLVICPDVPLSLRLHLWRQQFNTEYKRKGMYMYVLILSYFVLVMYQDNISMQIIVRRGVFYWFPLKAGVIVYCKTCPSDLYSLNCTCRCAGLSAPPRRCNHHTTMSTRKTTIQRSLHPRQLEMRTKLLVGSALLLWLFTRPRYSHWYPRPFGWGLGWSALYQHYLSATISHRLVYKTSNQTGC